MTKGQEKPIQTPCKNICVVDTEVGECIGCGRTRIEIANWMSMDDNQRQKIMSELDDRVASLTKRKKRKGGARARKRNRQPAAGSVAINFKGP